MPVVGLQVVLAAIALATPAAPAGQLGCIPGRPAALLVAYTRTGGFAGIREELRIFRGGQATLVHARGGRSTFRLTCARVRAVRDRLQQARFATLQPAYAPADPVADGFVDTVSYAGRRVSVLTGARPPERLARVLRILRSMASDRRLRLPGAG
jgi:hypothetical protein